MKKALKFGLFKNFKCFISETKLLKSIFQPCFNFLSFLHSNLYFLSQNISLAILADNTEPKKVSLFLCAEP